MRSDAQRDADIDLLLTKVAHLEAELARLRGQTPQGAAALPAPPPRLPPRPATTTPPRSGDSLESAIGTRWIGRVGVLAILFGVAFFLKYSFDNRLIGESGRVALGLAWGSAFLVAGEYLQRKRGMTLYGQLLSASGLTVLYLSLYAAFALYHLIPAPVAALGLLAVTTTGMTLALRYSAYSLAAIALGGGLLTPVMLSSGLNQPLTLFGYLLLLDCGALLLIRFRPWPSLGLLALVGTALLYAGWHARFFTDGQRWLALGVIALFFLLFTVHILLARLRERPAESRLDAALILASASLCLTAYAAQQHWQRTWPLTFCALILATIDIGLAEVIGRRASSAKLTMAALASASLMMTAAATCIALEGRWLGAALSAEMAASLWLGLRFQQPAIRRGAYLLGLAALLVFFDTLHFHLEPFRRFLPLANTRFFSCALNVAGLYVATVHLYHRRLFLLPEERLAPSIAFVLSQALTLVLLSVEVHDFFRFSAPGQHLAWGAALYGYQVSLSVLWGVYAALLIAVGIARRLRGARILGILVLGLTVAKVFLHDLSDLQTFYRIISFIVLGLLLLAVSYGYNRRKDLIFGDHRP